MITAILNAFKRPHTLKEQYDAVMSQTTGTSKVMLWSNAPEEKLDKFPVRCC